MLNKQFITQEELEKIYIPFWPGIIGCKDQNLKYISLNKTGLDFFKFSSEEEIIGLDDYQMPWNSVVDMLHYFDRRTMEQGSCFNLELIKACNGVTHTLLTQKIPLVNNSKQCVGVSIFSFSFKIEDLFNYHKAMTNQLKVFNPKMQTHSSNKRKYFEYKSLRFTRREAQCVSMILRGATIDEIANKICRSPRTVQKYYDSLREKLSSTKHSVVFQKAIEYGFIDLMFTLIE